jgi:uncharacterized protein (UPF0261 family)
VRGARAADRVQARRRDRARRAVRPAAGRVDDLWDPDADEALFAALRSGLAGSSVELVEVDAHVNDEAFAVAMAERLDALVGVRA